ncbi:MAG: hypothetical protein MUE70_16045 [Desulfobacterales bacterium]|nr:hypothetical protein [Desulfobacterales bacterium]
MSSDACAANNQRNAARKIIEDWKPKVNNVYFLGHWGFQYYMQEYGGVPFDYKSTKLKINDVIVYPTGNTNVQDLNKKVLALITSYDEDLIKPFSTMNSRTGAGFYSSVWGPLPYSVYDPEPFRYLIIALKP